MPSIASTFVAALAVTSTAAATVLPRNNDGKAAYYYKGRGSDPDFTIPQIELDSVVSCVGGIENAKKPFLLVPGSELAHVPTIRQYEELTRASHSLG